MFCLEVVIREHVGRNVIDIVQVFQLNCRRHEFRRPVQYKALGIILENALVARVVPHERDRIASRLGQLQFAHVLSSATNCFFACLSAFSDSFLEFDLRIVETGR